MEFDFGNYAQQGWQCPICKRVYSPTTPMCMYCGNEETVTTSSYTYEKSEDTGRYDPYTDKFIKEKK